MPQTTTHIETLEDFQWSHDKGLSVFINSNGRILATVKQNALKHWSTSIHPANTVYMSPQEFKTRAEATKHAKEILSALGCFTPQICVTHTKPGKCFVDIFPSENAYRSPRVFNNEADAIDHALELLRAARCLIPVLPLDARNF